MRERKMLTVTHAPFWHVGRTVTAKSYETMLAALPAVLVGIFTFGLPAVRVVALSIATAMLWELLIDRVAGRTTNLADGTAALSGLLLAMLLPATAPWWLVLTGTFTVIFVGKQVYGGLGCNPLNPVLVGLGMLMISWGDILDFDAALLNYDKAFPMAYPLAAVKHLGGVAADNYDTVALFLGHQSGGIGATCGLALVVGGIFLVVRNHIRWEIPLSFLAGLFVTTLIFHLADPEAYAGPVFHLLTGYTLVGAIFLATEDSSSPVHLIPMLIYGAGCGVLVALCRNIGAYTDGVVFSILLMNVLSPLLDKIRPKALGKVESHA